MDYLFRMVGIHRIVFTSHPVLKHLLRCWLVHPIVMFGWYDAMAYHLQQHPSDRVYHVLQSPPIVGSAAHGIPFLLDVVINDDNGTMRWNV